MIFYLFFSRRSTYSSGGIVFANTDEEDDDENDDEEDEEDDEESDSVPLSSSVHKTSPSRNHLQVMFIQMEFCEKSTLR